MGKKSKSKRPVLRKGLSVKALVGKHQSYKVVHEGARPYGHEPTEHIAHAIIIEAVQRLIDHVDAGNDVGRQQVREMMTTISSKISYAADYINEGISDGSLTPTLLDKIANV